MDPDLNPYDFYGMGTGSDPFNYYSAPGYATNFAALDYAPSGDRTVAAAPDDYPSQEASATRASRSAVPGTTGAPSYTPSATPGGVSGGGVPRRRD